MIIGLGQKGCFISFRVVHNIKQATHFFWWSKCLYVITLDRIRANVFAKGLSQIKTMQLRLRILRMVQANSFVVALNMRLDLEIKSF